MPSISRHCWTSTAYTSKMTKLSLVFICAFALVGAHQQAFDLNYFAPPQLGARNILIAADPNPAVVHHLNQHYFQQDAQARFRSRFNAPAQEEAAPRFFLNSNNLLGTGTGSNGGLFKTVVYVSTATTTVASISKCIQANNFAVGSQAIACPARKRREIASILDRIVLDDGDDAPIVPSPTTTIETTASPSEAFVFGGETKKTAIKSSKDDDVVEKVTGISEPQARLKRFFNLFLLTTTVTSYSFVTTLIPKQVSIVDAAGSLNCLPPGYGVC